MYEVFVPARVLMEVRILSFKPQLCMILWAISKLHDQVITIWGPIYWRGLALIPAWISNNIQYKRYDEITYPFPYFNSYTVKFGKG